MQHNTVLSSKDNVNIKRYQKLAASKKERYADGLFVLEGVRLVQDALLEQAQLECLMVTESALEKYPAFLAQADLREVRLLVISNELGAKIAQTEQPQGVFALCRMPRQEDYQPVLYRGGHFLMLHQLQDPGNLGMILRTADALGIDGVFLCGCCDVYSPKVIRATMGSVFRVPLWQEPDTDRLLCRMQAAGVHTYAAVIDPDARELRSCDFNGSAAVMIGNEGNGIPAQVADACDTRLTIRMQGHINSLNAAMAAGIILWELQGGQV